VVVGRDSPSHPDSPRNLGSWRDVVTTYPEDTHSLRGNLLGVAQRHAALQVTVDLSAHDNESCLELLIVPVLAHLLYGAHITTCVRQDRGSDLSGTTVNRGTVPAVPKSPLQPHRTTRRISTRLFTAFLLFVLVGFAHQLYRFVSLNGVEGVFGSRGALSELAAGRRRVSDTAGITVEITAGKKLCTGVPVRDTRIILTAAHCLVDEEEYALDPVSTVSVLTYSGRSLGTVVATWAHPRYGESTQDRLPVPLELIREALTWGSVRGEVLERSPYSWDVGFVIVDAPVTDIGVDGVDGDVSGQLSVFAGQLYRASGEPYCSLEKPGNCPGWSAAVGPEERLRREEVRCDVRGVRPGYEIDFEVLCGFFPGASGGALVEHRQGQVFLVGILVSGDGTGAVNGITTHSLQDAYSKAISVAG
jgi:hypothetical protein